jgi:hypothetical protein
MDVDGGVTESDARLELDPGAVEADAAEAAGDARRRGEEIQEDDEGDDARDEVVAGLVYRISMLVTDDTPQDGAEE